MNIKNINDQIFEMEKNIENLKFELEKIKNEESEKKSNENIHAVRRLKIIYSCYAKGMSPIEIAEYIKDDMNATTFDAYLFVNSIVWGEKEKIKFAKFYMIKSLYEAGFKKSEISKIAGYTPQRCGQIIKNVIF